MWTTRGSIESVCGQPDKILSQSVGNGTKCWVSLWKKRQNVESVCGQRGKMLSQTVGNQIKCWVSTWTTRGNIDSVCGQPDKILSQSVGNETKCWVSLWTKRQNVESVWKIRQNVESDSQQLHKTKGRKNSQRLTTLNKITIPWLELYICDRYITYNSYICQHFNLQLLLSCNFNNFVTLAKQKDKTP